jgi:hypothetical protein
MKRFLLENTVTKFSYTQNLWNSKIKILDIGLDNESISRAKLVYRNIETYHGLDIRDLSEAERKSVDDFYLLDLDSDNLEDLQDNFYDLILMNHVIEYLNRGLDAVLNLSYKVKDGGYFFIEFPNINSLSRNIYRDYHFHCDSTHKHIYSISEVANTLLSNNFKVISAGYSRPYFKIVSLFPKALKELIFGKKPSLSHMSNKISYVYARKSTNLAYRLSE